MISLVSLLLNRCQLAGAGFFVLLFSICFQASGQISLTEVGATLQGGYVSGTKGSGGGSGYGLGAQSFLTHYFCSKNHGYWFEVGYRYSHVTSGEFASGSSIIELGGYYKIRPEKYNRDEELAVLLGPKVNTVVSSIGDGATRALLGGHISLLYRIPIARYQSLFLRAGVEYFPEGQVSTGGRFYFFGGLALPLWNSI